MHYLSTTIRLILLFACGLQGLTCMHKAAIFGQQAVLKRLVEMGAKANVKDAAGDTPLHYASRCGFIPSVQALISAPGVSTTDTNAAGQTSVDVAATPAVKKLLAPQ